MQLKECYDAFGGNYEEVKGRLQSDALIQRLVIKFLADKNYEMLKQGLLERDYETAFRAAHTLKGVSMNLNFDPLVTSASELTELLRNYNSKQVDLAACMERLEQVSADYSQIVEAVQKLAAQG